MPCYKNGYANALPTGRKLKAIKMTDLQHKIFIYIYISNSPMHDEIFFLFSISRSEAKINITIHTLKDLILESLIMYLLKKLKLLQTRARK